MFKMADYESLGKQIGKLVAEKQQAYGNSYGHSGEILKILFPKGVQPEQYTELLAICRVVDKLFRLANDPTYGDESPWGDIVGYGLLRLGAWSDKAAEDCGKAFAKVDKLQQEAQRIDELYKLFDDHG